MSRSTRKPWVTDQHNHSRSKPRTKQIQNRRFRRVVRKDVRQWRHKYFYNTLRLCPNCISMAEWYYWECRACLAYELEPSYPLPHKFNDSYDVCDYRYYCDEPYYRRK